MRTRPCFALLVLLATTSCSSAPSTGSVSPPRFTSDHIDVVTRGSGPDVLLVHGLAGNRDLWAAVADALDERYRLHLVQIKGFGGAAASSGDSLVSAPVARELARYITEARLKRPAVIGHSMGGTIAMMLAARSPELPGRIMVVDMMPFLGVMFGAQTIDAVRPIAQQVRTQMLATEPGGPGDMFGQGLQTMTRVDSMKPVLMRYLKASDRRKVANAFYELVMTDLRPELARITVPMTVLYVVPPGGQVTTEQFDDLMRTIYSGARGARLIRVDDANHFIFFDQPARFISEVETFMRKAR